MEDENENEKGGERDGLELKKQMAMARKSIQQLMTIEAAKANVTSITCKDLRPVAEWEPSIPEKAFKVLQAAYTQVSKNTDLFF